jgi:hypothetical protein
MNVEFRIRDWGRFQHYKKREEDGKPSRAPTWIKTYTKLLSDPNWLGLTDGQRGFLLGLWLWWGSQDLGEGWQELSELRQRLINRALATHARASTWNALNSAGFIEIRDSDTHEVIRQLAMPEEKRRDNEQLQGPPTDVPRDVEQADDVYEAEIVSLDEHRTKPDVVISNVTEGAPAATVNGRPIGEVLGPLLEGMRARGRESP